MGSLDGLDLGKYGIYTFDFEHLTAEEARSAIQELEELGWRAFWFPELLGREALTHAGFLLSVTERMHVVNGIAKIFKRPSRSTFGAARLLADAYPDRHVLGLGFGGGLRDTAGVAAPDPRSGLTPMQAMVAYLDELDALEAEVLTPAPQAPVRRVLAAYGPKMLQLARDRSLGAHTYKVNVPHTVQAREILGPEPFLAVEQAVLFEADPDRARAIAREHLDVYLTSGFNPAKFRRLGYAQDEIDHGGSDRIVDDLVAWGDDDAIVERLQAQVDAGADHVAIQVIGTEPGPPALQAWRRLAAAVGPAPASATV